MVVTPTESLFRRKNATFSKKNLFKAANIKY
nr:MAG TPA: hypothetical protein [Caudoviricetes sp.]